VSNTLQLTTFRHPLTTLAVTTAALLNAALFIGVFTSPPALAQIRSNPSAPGNQRPTVLLAPNGVPVVNIQTPSAPVFHATPTVNSMFNPMARF